MKKIHQINMEFILYCRLVAAAPCIREQFWSLSKYVLSQLNSILKARSQQQVNVEISIHSIALYRFN